MSNLNSFQDYFDEIKNIWEKLESPNRIIPFCTPMKLNPKFLVIGINHSDFCPQNSEKSKRIANDFSKGIPKENTYKEHNHSFARGLRAVIERVHNEYNDFDCEPSNEWIGTNRIAIQTDSEGSGVITSHKKYKECQSDMDKILKSLISYTKPKNIILAGNAACDNFYYSKGQTMANKKVKKVLVDKETRETTNVIPVWHFSWTWTYSKTETRIKAAIKNNLCDY